MSIIMTPRQLQRMVHQKYDELINIIISEVYSFIEAEYCGNSLEIEVRFRLPDAEFTFNKIFYLISNTYKEREWNLELLSEEITTNDNESCIQAKIRVTPLL